LRGEEPRVKMNLEKRSAGYREFLKRKEASIGKKMVAGEKNDRCPVQKNTLFE